MLVATETQRIGLRLDRGILIERLILSHVATLGARRAQDWLRSLLVHGFLTESRLLRELGTSAAPRASGPPTAARHAMPGSTFAMWHATHAQKQAPQVVPAIAARAVAPTPAGGVNDKPFAHLRNVVG